MQRDDGSPATLLAETEPPIRLTLLAPSSPSLKERKYGGPPVLFKISAINGRPGFSTVARGFSIGDSGDVWLKKTSRRGHSLSITSKSTKSSRPASFYDESHGILGWVRAGQNKSTCNQVFLGKSIRSWELGPDSRLVAYANYHEQSSLQLFSLEEKRLVAELNVHWNGLACISHGFSSRGAALDAFCQGARAICRRAV